MSAGKFIESLIRGKICKCFLLFCLPCLVWAQDPLSHWEIGVTAGGMNYIGDLNKQSVLGKVNLAFGIVGRYNISDRWSVAVTGSYGHLQGGEPDVIALRNLSFRSYLWEGAARVEFNFVPFGTSGIHFRTTPFLFCGLGFFSFNPTAQYADPVTGEQLWTDLQPLHTEGQSLEQFPDRKPYSLAQIAFPFGFGFKIAFSKSITMTMEYGFRKTWTDYIDDVSTTYVGEQALGVGSLSALLADRSGEVEPGYVNAAGIQRGDDSLDDWYAYFNLSLVFNMQTLFGWMRSKKCDIK